MLYEVTTKDLSARDDIDVGYQTVIYKVQEADSDSDGESKGPNAPLAIWERTRDPLDRSRDHLQFRGNSMTLGEWLPATG